MYQLSLLQCLIICLLVGLITIEYDKLLKSDGLDADTEAFMEENGVNEVNGH